MNFLTDTQLSLYFLAFNQIAEVTKNGAGFNHFNLAVKTLDFVEEKANQFDKEVTLYKNS